MDAHRGIARQACDTCRVRKTRCDRVLPRCARCIRVGDTCGYTGPKMYSSREHLSGRLDQLQTRLAQAEAQLSTPHLPKLAASASPGPFAFQLQTPDAGYPPEVQQPMAANILPPQDDYIPIDPGLMVDLAPEPPADQSFTTSFPDGMDFFSKMNVDWPSEPAEAPETDLPTPVHDPTTIHVASQDSPETPDELGQVSFSDLSMLHQKYFAVLYRAWPFLSETTFEENMKSRAESPPILALSHAVALFATSVSPSHQSLQADCYIGARRYIEMSEMDDSQDSLISLSLFQALVFVVRYEITSQPLNRAWMTLGRAIRLSKMLNLHKIDSFEPNHDSSTKLGSSLAPPRDALELEERRRSFWSLYILESYVSTRTGIPCELGDANSFQTRLPSPGPLDSSFQEKQMPFLGEVGSSLPQALPSISAYTGCILMVELTLQCFEHIASQQSRQEGGRFWDNHYRLIKEFTQRASLLKTHLDTSAVKSDPISFSLHMNLCAAEIHLQEAAIREVRGQELPESMAAESRRCSTAAAFRIANAVRLNWASRGSESDLLALQATFVAWPLATAMRFLSEELASADAKSLSDGVAVSHSLRLLQAALDHVENPDGYWHSLTHSVASTLQLWDERSGINLNSL